jgi:hypothetical protein
MGVTGVQLRFVFAVLSVSALLGALASCGLTQGSLGGQSGEGRGAVGTAREAVKKTMTNLDKATKSATGQVHKAARGTAKSGAGGAKGATTKGGTTGKGGKSGKGGKGGKPAGQAIGAPPRRGGAAGRPHASLRRPRLMARSGGRGNTRVRTGA